MRRVSSLKDVRAALAAGERAFVSDSFAACYAGVNYYQAMVKELRDEFGEFAFTLCCGDDAAIAHDALRVGFKHILCDCGDAQFAELTEVAKELNATVQRG